jgi:hypothetical protein
MIFVNNSGLGGLPVSGTGNSTVKVFVFDEATGAPLKGLNGQDVCRADLCTFTLAPGEKSRFTVEKLATDNAGGLDGAGAREVVTAYAVATVEGDGAAQTTAFAFIVNSHTSAFDLSVIGFQPAEIDGAP